MGQRCAPGLAQRRQDPVTEPLASHRSVGTSGAMNSCNIFPTLETLTMTRTRILETTFCLLLTAGLVACSSNTDSGQRLSEQGGGDDDRGDDGDDGDECVEQCFVAFDECWILSDGDPEYEGSGCEQELSVCLDSCPEQPRPPDECEQCHVELEQCIFSYGDEEDHSACYERFDECVQQCEPWPRECPDSCFIDYDQCVDVDVEPEPGDQDDPDDSLPWGPCEEQLDICLADCEPLPPPPECQEECFRGYDECVNNCGDEGETQHCELELDECLQFCGDC